jgi:hypothetical protein
MPMKTPQQHQASSQEPKTSTRCPKDNPEQLITSTSSCETQWHPTIGEDGEERGKRIQEHEAACGEELHDKPYSLGGSRRTPILGVDVDERVVGLRGVEWLRARVAPAMFESCAIVAGEM